MVLPVTVHIPNRSSCVIYTVFFLDTDEIRKNMETELAEIVMATLVNVA